VRTVRGAGKVKRIRNNSHVRIMPCGVQGEPMGQWADAEARVALDAEVPHAMQLLNTKYAEAMRQMGRNEELEKRGVDVIVLKLLTVSPASI
jgi:hypothetical protein